MNILIFLCFLKLVSYSGQSIKREATAFYYDAYYNHPAGQILRNNYVKLTDQKYFLKILLYMKSCDDI